MKKEMLINVLQSEESRIAILEDGVLEELYVERGSIENCVGNIYKGRVVNIEPSIQAVFVDFGVGRNGFLHVSDVEYQYYKHLLPNGGKQEQEDDPRAPRGRRRFNERSVRNKPPIQEIFRRGSEVLVQVIKEGIGSKGPTLSTYISIPGRYLVLMPGLQRVGVSRKIADDDVRRKLRQALLELNPPQGLGFIIRTAGTDRAKRDLHRDLNYLLRLWRTIVRRIRKTAGPVGIYEESDMIIRTIRDIYNSEIDTVLIDEPQAFERAREFMKIVMPRNVNRIKLYEGKEALFHKYHIEDEIARIQTRHVPLRGGGSIVIDQTEARRQCGRDGLPGQPEGRRRNQSSNSPARPGGHDRQRFHRHAGGAPPPRCGAGIARSRSPRPGKNQGTANQPVWPHRDDTTTDPALIAAQHLRGLPLLPQHRASEDRREYGHRYHAAVDDSRHARGRVTDRRRNSRPRRQLS
jgi:Rne/Rng family ribonuclease